MQLKTRTIDKQLTWPITFLNEQLVTLFEHLIKVVSLNANELRAFSEKNHVRRHPISPTDTLPIAAKLNPNKPIDFDEMLCHIINHHAITDRAQHYTIEHEQGITTIHYIEGFEQHVTASLQHSLTLWKDNLYNALAHWHFESTHQDIVIYTAGPSYIVDILRFCTRLNAKQFAQAYPIQAKQNRKGYFDIRLSLRTEHYPNIDPDHDFDTARQLLTKTGIRMDCGADYMIETTETIENIHQRISRQQNKTPFEKEFLRYFLLFTNIFKLFAESEKRDENLVRTRIDQLYQRLCQQFPEIESNPRATHYLARLSQLSIDFELSSSLNTYAENHNNFASNSRAKVRVEPASAQEKVQYTINFEQLTAIEFDIIEVNNLLSKQNLNNAQITQLIECLTMLNQFYKDPQVSYEAKQQLAQLCYAGFLKPLSEIYPPHKTSDNDALDKTELSFRTAQYPLTKHTANYLDDNKHISDCSFFIQTVLTRLITHYCSKQEWEWVDYYLERISFVERSRQTIEYGSTNATFFKLSTQTMVLIARGALTQAIYKFDELNTLFDKQLKGFCKPNNVQQKLPELQFVYTSVFQLNNLGQKITDALSNEQQNPMAHAMASSISQLLEKRVNKLFTAYGGFLKNSAHPEANFISTEHRRLSQQLKCALESYEQRHLELLRSSIAQVNTNELDCTPTKQKHTVAFSTHSDNLPFIKQAMHKHRIATTIKDNIVTLKDALSINQKGLVQALNTAQRLISTPISPSKANQKKLSDYDDSSSSETVERIRYSELLDLHRLKSNRKTARPKKSRHKNKNMNTAAAQPAKPIEKPEKPLVVQFGDQLGAYDESNPNASNIVALQSAHCPYGVFFGYIDDALPPDVRQHFMKALANRGKNRGHIVTGKGQEGVKFFKKSANKAWKIKIPRQDEFLIGHIKMVKAELDQHGLPIKRFLICFDRIGNHKQEQRAQKNSTMQ